MRGPGADHCNLVPHSLSYELSAVFGCHIGRNTTQDELVRQRIDGLCRVQLAFHSDRQAFPAVVIQDVHSPECLFIICPVVLEVIQPNVVTILMPQPDT